MSLDKEVIKTLVRDTFNRQIDDKIMAEKTPEPEPTPEPTPEPVSEPEPLAESTIEEASTVSLFSKDRLVATKDINSIKDLNIMAKTGMYDHMTVHSASGTTEYVVSGGKLTEI